MKVIYFGLDIAVVASWKQEMPNAGTAE